MVLELTPVELRTQIFTMNYMPHLLLPFAFYWTGNRILDLVTSYEDHMHAV